MTWHSDQCRDLDVVLSAMERVHNQPRLCWMGEGIVLEQDCGKQPAPTPAVACHCGNPPDPAGARRVPKTDKVSARMPALHWLPLQDKPRSRWNCFGWAPWPANSVENEPLDRAQLLGRVLRLCIYQFVIDDTNSLFVTRARRSEIAKATGSAFPEFFLKFFKLFPIEVGYLLEPSVHSSPRL